CGGRLSSSPLRDGRRRKSGSVSTSPTNSRSEFRADGVREAPSLPWEGSWTLAHGARGSVLQAHLPVSPKNAALTTRSSGWAISEALRPSREEDDAGRVLQARYPPAVPTSDSAASLDSSPTPAARTGVTWTR